jgi:valyl-tRNA synthetase
MLLLNAVIPFILTLSMFAKCEALLRLRNVRRMTMSSVFSKHQQFTYAKKPDFSVETDGKYFEFKRLEREIYQWWEKSGFFEPSGGKKPFVVPMPPPNVTGYLHMGHAIFLALQDIMVRYNRMTGRSTLWLPGT